MPGGRRPSVGSPLDLDQFHHLENIKEREEGSVEGDHRPGLHLCQAPKDFACLAPGDNVLYENELNSSAKLICTNSNCRVSPFMHGDCFKAWESSLINFLKSEARARGWSEKHLREQVWTKRGFELVAVAATCSCLSGHLRKDLNWQPARLNSLDVDVDKMKKRKRKNSKNGKPTLTIGLPTLNINSNQMKRSDAQGIPPLNRIRTNSLSSTASGSSSFSSLSSPANSPPSDSSLTPRDSSLTPPRRSGGAMDRNRHDSGGSIFLRRPDYSSFNVLPKHKINSYHIKMEDECSIGNDDTRSFILSNYATNKMNRVPCVLCAGSMNIYDRYPLIDGTFFLSPRQHTQSCIKVKVEGKSNYLSAVCMGCLEGWTNSLHCRWCLTGWDGSQLILGTMYSYDIFAAVPCCPHRLKCTACNQLVIHPDQRFNFFSDYSQTISCPGCGVQDFHFTKPIRSFVSRDQLTQAAASNPNLGRTWAAAVKS